MQRRVAAIYFAFFLVVGVAAYSMLVVAEEPTVNIPGEELQENDTLTVNGQEYTLTSLEAQTGDGGGGHGGGGGVTYIGTLSYVDDSYQFAETFQNNSTVDYQESQYRVFIANESGVSSFELRQDFNVSRRLAEDPAVENETVTREDGQEYVVYRENGSTRPLSEYLPEPNVEEYSEGDEFDFRGNQTTVENVTAEEVTLTWTGEREGEVELEEGVNVTLAGGEDYFAHFKGHGEEVESVVVSSAAENYGAYQADLDRQDYFDERVNGLWGVVILSGVAAMLIVGLAYMPVKG
jgi:hypothetical protein